MFTNVYHSQMGGLWHCFTHSNFHPNDKHRDSAKGWGALTGCNMMHLSPEDERKYLLYTVIWTFRFPGFWFLRFGGFLGFEALDSNFWSWVSCLQKSKENCSTKAAGDLIFGELGRWEWERPQVATSRTAGCCRHCLGISCVNVPVIQIRLDMQINKEEWRCSPF